MTNKLNKIRMNREKVRQQQALAQDNLNKYEENEKRRLHEKEIREKQALAQFDHRIKATRGRIESYSRRHEKLDSTEAAISQELQDR